MKQPPCRLRIGSVGQILAMAVALTTFAGPAWCDEVTIEQPIVELRYNANADYAFFVGASTWGAPSCPNAYYAQVPASVAGRKQLLALATAAKLSGTKVSFQGSCSSDPLYFNAYYIVVGR